jgi:hypothetical protein
MTNRAMLLKRGAYCPDVNRATKTLMNFVCSPEAKMTSIREEMPCQYTGVFATRAAYNLDVVAGIKRAPIEDLERVAEHLGLERDPGESE